METSRLVPRKDLEETYRVYLGCVKAGNQQMADNYLGLSLSLHGTNLHRIARENDYWEEYQRVMVGRRIDRLSYVVGKTVPLRDQRPWAIHAGRRAWQAGRPPLPAVQVSNSD